MVRPVKSALCIASAIFGLALLTIFDVVDPKVLQTALLVVPAATAGAALRTCRRSQEA